MTDKKEIINNQLSENNMTNIMQEVNKKTSTKSIKEKKEKVYDNQPLGPDGKPYENKSSKRHSRLKNNVKNAGIASGKVRGWDMTGKYFMGKPDLEQIPDNLLRLMTQKVRDGIPRRIAARVCGLAENVVEYRMDKGLHYTDKAMSDQGVVEVKTYLKDEVLKAEAQMEETARQGIMIAMKKGNLKATQQFLESQKEEVEKRFNDRAEYRQLAQDMGLSKKEYIWCLNVLNGIPQQQASINVGRAKSMNMYHYRMNPAVKEFIKEVKQQRRRELLDSVPFDKQTAQESIQYVLGTLIQEIEKPDNTKQDLINLTREIRNTAETMGKATMLFPKEDVQTGVTNIAILAGENTDAVLGILGRKHDTKALNITQFANEKTQGGEKPTAGAIIEGGTATESEGTMSE